MKEPMCGHPGGPGRPAGTGPAQSTIGEQWARRRNECVALDSRLAQRGRVFVMSWERGTVFRGSMWDNPQCSRKPRHVEGRGDSLRSSRAFAFGDEAREPGHVNGRLSERKDRGHGGLRAGAHGPIGQPSHAVPPFTRLPHAASILQTCCHMRTRADAGSHPSRSARTADAGSAPAQLRSAPTPFVLRGEKPTC